MRKYFLGTVAGLIVLAIILFGISKLTSSSGLNELPNYPLPNYPQIKGEYNVKAGIQYNKQPHLGNQNAPIKIVEFADFKCPACQQWEAENFQKFKTNYIDTGKVEFYFMNFAFIDRDSIMAASAGEAIAKQNNEKFWEYYSLLYKNQGDEEKIWATSEFLESFVRDNIAGLDYDMFKKDMLSNDMLLRAKEDFKVAGHLGVNGTPQFSINGKLSDSSSYDKLVSKIEKALSESK